MAATAGAGATTGAGASTAAAAVAAAEEEGVVVALAGPAAETVAVVTKGASSGWHCRPGRNLHHPTRNGGRRHTRRPRNAGRTGPESRRRSERPARTDPSRKIRGWAVATEARASRVAARVEAARAAAAAEAAMVGWAAAAAAVAATGEAGLAGAAAGAAARTRWGGRCRRNTPRRLSGRGPTRTGTHKSRSPRSATGSSPC